MQKEDARKFFQQKKELFFGNIGKSEIILFVSAYCLDLLTLPIAL